jgi:hypothetical protein
VNNNFECHLSPIFTQQLVYDGFKPAGYYEIDQEHTCRIFVEKEVGDWQFCVYTHVSYANGGRHVRIGKSELPLRVRMNSWPRLIGQALQLAPSQNLQFKGGTPPWEAQGWADYTVPYGGRGLLFALCVERRSTLEETKIALRRLERQLQDRYDPPLCNDTAAGRILRDQWVRKRGQPVVVRKREGVMTRVKTRILIGPDGTLTGWAPGLPAGEHEAEVMLIESAGPAPRLQVEALLARVRAIQEEVARLPVLDSRHPDQILGYNDRGHFD